MPTKLAIIVLLTLLCCRSKSEERKPFALEATMAREMIRANDLEIPVYDFKGIEPLLHKEDGTTYIVNFWATWCAPCIKELPYFEQVRDDYKDDSLEVILVSLDMPKMWDSHLVPFVKERNLKSHVVVLDDPKQNSWIPMVDKDWSGAIPATLIYNGKKRIFREEPFTYEELNKVLSNF